MTINAVYTQILHTVSFRVMDEGIIHTMEVPDRYVLQEEDYPTIPKRVGYTSRWDTRVTMIVRDTIIDAIYSDGSTHEVTFLAYGNENLGTITVEDGYLLQEEDYPTIPERTGYRGSWPTQVDPIYEDTIIHAQYEEAIPVPTLPTSPGEIMSGGEGEPVEADEPEEGENDTTPAETEHTISGVLASTETVTHEYLTQSGKVVRETITTSMDTTTLDFFYDESGRPFAFNYTPEGSTPNTYYYILNLQGDVVQGESLGYLRTCGKFDLIFLDPPYDTGLLDKALENVVQFDILAEGGIIVCESRREKVLPQLRAPYHLLTERNYGKIKLTLYGKGTHA